MIKITVYNETETDRNEIIHFLSKMKGARDIVLEEKPQLGMMTFLSEQHTVIRLYCSDIFYFEYQNRKVKIVTLEKEYICINEKISNIAKKMKPYGFAMCHQSFVVNLYEIERIKAQELIMKNGDTVYLAQKRAATIRKEWRSQEGKILI